MKKPRKRDLILGLDEKFINMYNTDPHPYYESTMLGQFEGWTGVRQRLVECGAILRLRRHPDGQVAYVPSDFGGKLEPWMRDNWSTYYKLQIWEELPPEIQDDSP